jgi:hypothetical protein
MNCAKRKGLILSCIWIIFGGLVSNELRVMVHGSTRCVKEGFLYIYQY